MKCPYCNKDFSFTVYPHHVKACEDIHKAEKKAEVEKKAKKK